VTRQELDRELTTMADSGIGGVEVAYVYPLAMAATEFGSDAFLADLRFAAERAHELGLSFDLTLGSGWSFGGRHISTELAARQLHWGRREIGPGPLEVPVVSAWPGDELITAYVGAGSLQERPTSYQRLPVDDGRILIKAGTGPRVVLLAYARLTGQNVKRAALGAEGPVLDHYSAAAIEAHLQAVGDPMLDAVPTDLVGSSSATVSRRMARTGRVRCRRSLPGAAVTTCFRCCIGLRSMSLVRHGFAPTITTPWLSCIRRTS